MKFLRPAIKNFLPYIFVFISGLYLISDPDLGWHLRYGKYFFDNHRLLTDNTFSTQMPDFQWINISWGIDVLSYAIYSLGGMFTLILAGAIVTTLAFFFFSKAYRLDYWDKMFVFPLLLFFLMPINSTSFRGQTLSLAFLGAMILILSRYERERKNILFFMPLLFILWANIHGLFILGLGIMFLWKGFYLVSLYLNKRSLEDIMEHVIFFAVIAVLSVGATIIHPFGIDIYKDAWLHFQNPLLKNILEYLPPGEFTTQWYNLYFAALLAFVGLMLHLVNDTFKKKLPQLGTFSVLFALSLWVKRYSWAMYYMLIIFISPVAAIFKPKTKKTVFKFATVVFVIYTFAALYLKGPFNKYTNMSWDIYCERFNKCSLQAASELKKYYIEGKTMTLYNWGGWLIWNYPDLKPSTDGRMHLWLDENGYSAFEYDYKLEQDITDIDDSQYEVVFTGKFKPIYNRLVELVNEDKWEMVYEDDTTAIFIRG